VLSDFVEKRKRMKIAIIGAGALGCYYGAKLALSGEEVHIVARGATLEALRTRGITVHRDDGSFTVSPFHVTDDAAEIGPVDLILVATKSYSLDSIAPALRALKGPETIVLPIQNGVDSAERLGALTDPAHILGGLTYLPASKTGPGEVTQKGVEKPILLGTLNAADEPSAEAALAVLLKAGIAAERPADIRVALWMKYMLVIGTMGVQSVTGGTIGATRSDPDTRALYESCMSEVLEVAQRSGIQLPADAVEQAMSSIDSYPPTVKASMLQDLESGKPLELDAMHGTMVRLGKAAGVATPVNQFIYAALKLRENGAFR
jgi:2-dehydropantoate 2-reductase